MKCDDNNSNNSNKTVTGVKQKVAKKHVFKKITFPGFFHRNIPAWT